MESRTSKTIRNAKWGLINKLAHLILPFIVRSVLIYKLGDEYSGLSSLFTSVLTMLSLTELGFSNAIVYSMYKPIAENDRSKVCALLNVYKKAYRIIGLIITVIGLSIIPFIKYMIKGSAPADINLYILYLIYLFNTVISYFMYAYKTSMLSANQREDVLSRNSFINSLLIHILQCAVLLMFSDYYIYAVVLPISTIFLNLRNKRAVDELYPEYEPCGRITEQEKRDLKENIIGLMIWKVGGTTRNTLDSIVISMYIGLSTVAIYNNYYIIMNGLIGILGVATVSMLAGIGNKVAVDTPENNYNDFKKFQFFYMFISTWCVACLMSLYQPFMKLWMGENRLLPDNLMILMCLYFLILKKGDINSVYYQAAGLWWKGKMRSVVEAIMNLILNFVLGKYFGLYGIVLATILSCTIVSFYGSSFIFTCYFKNNKLPLYFLNNFVYISIGMITGYLIYRFTRYFNSTIGVSNALVVFLMDGVIVGVLAFAALTGIYSTKREFRGYLKDAKYRIQRTVQKMI